MQARSLVVCLVCGSGFLGCGGPEGEASGDAPTEVLSRLDGNDSPDRGALYFLNSARWPTPTIPVCWDTPGSEMQKGWVRAAVEGQYENRTEFFLDFVGWGLCAPGEKGIHIIVMNEWPRTAYLGVNNNGVTGGVLLNFVFTAFPKDFKRCVINPARPSTVADNKACIEYIAVHEFGHAIGLAHEQNRPDTPSTCDKAPQGPNGDTTTGIWDLNSVMNYCSPSWNNNGQLSIRDRDGLRRMYGAWSATDIRTGDFDGDKSADRLYRQPGHLVSGPRFVPTLWVLAYGKGGGTTWSGDWCTSAGLEMSVADFDGDGKSDLLCRDKSTGYVWLDYAANGLKGTDTEANLSFCTLPFVTGEVSVGDFNHDGKADLLCRNPNTGEKWITFARAGGFNPRIDWHEPAGWCSGIYGLFRVADFDGDGYADIFCHDTRTGQKWIRYAPIGGAGFMLPWSGLPNWCSFADAQLEIGDFNADRKADLLCHNKSSGESWIAYSKGGGSFTGSDWYENKGRCKGTGARFSIADQNGDGRADFLCDTPEQLHWEARNGLFNGLASSLDASGFPYFW